MLIHILVTEKPALILICYHSWGGSDMYYDNMARCTFIQ